MSGDLLRRLVSAGNDDHRNLPRWNESDSADTPSRSRTPQVIRHRMKALRLAPERLNGWVNVRGKFPYLANQPLERSRRRGTKDPDEPPRRARCPAAQQDQARSDDAEVREHGANARQVSSHLTTSGRVEQSSSTIQWAGRAGQGPERSRDGERRTRKSRNCQTSGPPARIARPRRHAQAQSRVRRRFSRRFSGTSDVAPGKAGTILPHARVNFAISGCTSAQLSDEAAIPASSSTTGLPLPWQMTCSR